MFSLMINSNSELIHFSVIENNLSSGAQWELNSEVCRSESHLSFSEKQCVKTADLQYILTRVSSSVYLYYQDLVAICY